MRLAALVAFVAGVCALQLQSTLPSSAAIAAFGVAGIALLGALAFYGGPFSGGQPAPPSRALWLAAAAALIGFTYAAARSAERLADGLPHDHEGRTTIVEGLVASLPARLERGVRFEFDVERVHTGGATVPRRLLLGWYGEAAIPRPAERWRFAVRLKRPHGAQNPGGFDLEAWLFERNLRATGHVGTGRRDPPPERLDDLVGAPGALVERARFHLRDRLLALLEGRRYGGVILALIVGDQRAIAASDWSVFNRTGIAHLVSISGLHITMIAGLAGGCLAALWRRTPALVGRIPAQTAGVCAGLLAAVGYALLAGWGVPAQRTVLMLAVVGTAWLAQTRIGLGTALALAAAVVCLMDPWAVLAAGFWLSFGAVAAIAWVVQGRPTTAGWRHALAVAARVQFAVTLALIPATVVLFHQLSLVSPLANAVAIPVVSWVVTPLALLGGALAMLPGIAGAAAGLLLAASHAIFAWLAEALSWTAGLPAAAAAVPTPPWAVTALALAGIAWLLAPPGWPARWLGVAVALPLLVWPPERPGIDEAWVTALDVGQGSAVLVETHDRAWLYDTGPRYASDADAGERIVLPYLRHRGLAALDGVVVSHLDADHSGGAAAILRGFRVARVLSSIPATHALFDGRTVERCEAGDRWRDGALAFELLHPAAEDYGARRTTNAMSCVVLITGAGRRMLLTGDIGVAEERVILARDADVAADWALMPHHGSRSSSSEAWVGALGARDAMAQAGYRNRHGHPDPGVTARYAGHGIAVHRTDWSGALQWRFAADGTVHRSAWRTERVRYWHNRPRQAEPTTEETIDEAPPVPLEPFIAG